MDYDTIENMQYAIRCVIQDRVPSVVLEIISLQEIEDYLLTHGIELDKENTLETNSHIDVWVRDTTNTYQISGDMWTGIYTFERLNELEK